MNSSQANKSYHLESAETAILTEQAPPVRTYSQDDLATASISAPSDVGHALADDSSASPWQTELRQAIRDPHTLCRQLGLDSSIADQAAAAMGHFSMFVPRGYLERIEPNNQNDPLLRQILPVEAEGETRPRFLADPVGDGAATLTAGLLKKYAGRALLMLTGQCAIHCRYCFRRNFPYDQLPHSKQQWEQAMQEISADPTLDEIILSGGDPLMLGDRRLHELIGRIVQNEHIIRLRLHTRMPVVLPGRVTRTLLDVLTGTRLAPIVVIHANHARELSAEVASAIESMRQAGIVLLNQAVLLRGVNDSIDAQVGLSKRLLQIGVMPYYLHQLDRAQGTAHFEVPVEQGRDIIRQLRFRLPGYGIPRYVQEVAGEPCKMPLEGPIS